MGLEVETPSARVVTTDVWLSGEKEPPGETLRLGQVVRTDVDGEVRLHVVTTDWAWQQTLPDHALADVLLDVLDAAAGARVRSVRIPTIGDARSFRVALARALNVHFSAPSPIEQVGVEVPLPRFRRAQALSEVASSRCDMVRPFVEAAAEAGFHPSALPRLAQGILAGIAARRAEFAVDTEHARAELESARTASWVVQWRTLYGVVSADVFAIEPIAAVRLASEAPPRPIGRTPPEKLALLLMDAVSPEARAHHLALLRREGYAGDERACLTENILRKGPVPVLTAYTDGFTRARLARDHGLTIEAPSDDQATATLLRACDFPVLAPARGIGAFRNELARLQRLTHVEPGAIERVNPAGRVLEALLKSLLRFHIEAHWGVPVDAFENRWWKPGEFEGLALGGLLDAAQGLQRRLRLNPPDAAAEHYRQLYGDRSFLPGDPERIRAIRNACSHDGRPVETTDVAEFFDQALALVDHLRAGSPPLFPTIVTVHARREDVSGVTWEARDEDGLEERLHTDLPLSIGCRYFLLARSNPVRVFPVLIRV